MATTPTFDGAAIQAARSIAELQNIPFSPSTLSKSLSSSRIQSTVESVCYTPGGFSSTAIVGYTWQRVEAQRGKGYLFRIGMINPTAATVTIDKTTITPSDTYVPSGDPTGGIAPINVTFSGSASVTLAAAGSAAGQTVTFSDVMTVAPLDRVDLIGGPILWHIRHYIANGGAASYAYSNMPLFGTIGQTSTLLTRVGGFMVGDKIATPTGMVAANPNFFLPAQTEFYGLSRVTRIMEVGDSIPAGQGVQGSLGTYGEIAVNLLNAGSTLPSPPSNQAKFFTFINYGWASQIPAVYFARLAAALTSPPDIVILDIYSRNQQPSSQAQISANDSLTMTAYQQIIAAGASVIIRNAFPNTGMTLANDNIRKGINARWKLFSESAGIPFLDVDILASDQASPASYLPGMTGDGTHPSLALNILCGQALATLISGRVLV